MTLIALDSNVVVGLAFPDRPLGEALKREADSMLRHGDDLRIPVFCIGEAWRVLTERRGRAHPPGDVLRALTTMQAIAPLLFPGQGYWPILQELLQRAGPLGANVFDFQILAVAIEHGADAIWTFDRAFPADGRLQVVDPLAG